jgi:hypothetical protein
MRDRKTDRMAVWSPHGWQTIVPYRFPRCGKLNARATRVLYAPSSAIGEVHLMVASVHQEPAAGQGLKDERHPAASTSGMPNGRLNSKLPLTSYPSISSYPACSSTRSSRLFPAMQVNAFNAFNAGAPPTARLTKLYHIGFSLCRWSSTKVWMPPHNPKYSR